MKKRLTTKDYITGTIFDNTVEDILRNATRHNGSFNSHALEILDNGLEQITEMINKADKEIPRTHTRFTNSDTEKERILPYEIRQVISLYIELAKRFQSYGVNVQNTSRFHSNDHISRVHELELDFVFAPGYSKRLREIRRKYQKDGENGKPEKFYDKLGGGINHDYGKIVEDLIEYCDESGNWDNYR